MTARRGEISRSTSETQIAVCIALDGEGQGEINSGIGFFDHMLQLFARHGLLDLTVHAIGDLEVDCHHTVEDCGIALGQALAIALGDKAGITRYGTAWVPMDEALAMVSLDISGRPFLVFDAALPQIRLGEFDLEMVEEFFRALAIQAGLTLHIRLQSGKNAHHMVEAIFKAFGRALREAVRIDPAIKGVMSTKGVL
ncbi:imidazoleglycerol-phosphate dehydratase HisB [Azotosporobacter soli]|uniref:imidazoleglycerol-phosphate dehydratase HisB n=1 Tax=Azotosporobacter soli TaxID=3055040 RepID=UPI0031FF03FA